MKWIEMKERIGILTSGGDCPGLNAVIRAVVRGASAAGEEVIGIRDGWLGLVEGNIEPLTRNSVTGILPRGGTILGTTRFDPTKDAETLAAVGRNWKQYGLKALIVVGGDGSLKAAQAMWRDYGYKIVCVPKTIDNDLGGTDFTFGFDTAVNTVTDAIDKLHSTAESHHRIMVIEVMGRHTGWIAAYGGLAGGADAILVPEHPFKLSRVCEVLLRRQQEGRAFSIVVVAEDAHPHPEEDFLSEETSREIFQHSRLGGIGAVLGQQIEERTGIETRVTKLGYVQRGGSPTPFDRVLATRFGVKAFEMVMREQWGQMAALRGNRIISVSIEEAVSRVKHLDEEIYELAELFFS